MKFLLPLAAAILLVAPVWADESTAVALARARAAVIPAPAPDPGLLSYSAGYRQALASGRPLVIWVDTDPRGREGELPDAVHCKADCHTIPQAQEAAVVVARASTSGGMDLRGVLPVTADAATIRRTLLPAAQTTTAAQPALWTPAASHAPAMMAPSVMMQAPMMRMGGGMMGGGMRMMGGGGMRRGGGGRSSGC